MLTSSILADWEMQYARWSLLCQLTLS
jgi:hypothetical protein